MQAPSWKYNNYVGQIVLKTNHSYSKRERIPGNAVTFRDAHIYVLYAYITRIAFKHRASNEYICDTFYASASLILRVSTLNMYCTVCESD